jgi:hypothetical protein
MDQKEFDAVVAYMMHDFPNEVAVHNKVRIYDGLYTPERLSHVAKMCWSIVQALAGKHAPGSFVHAVLMNDLMDAFRRADDINTVCMWSYCNFLYNEVPVFLRELYQEKNS